MSHLILLTGGVRSGKSAQAERLLAGSPAVLYIATARCLDGEMARRIEAHRSRRPAHWVTAEASAALDEVLRAHPEGDVLLDCVTNMVTNLMLDEEPEYEALSRARVEEIEAHIVRKSTGCCPACGKEAGWPCWSPARWGSAWWRPTAWGGFSPIFWER